MAITRTGAPEDAVVKVESEPEPSPGDADGRGGELLRLYRAFSLAPVDLECIPPAQALAENAPIAAGIGAGREKGGWWMDALAAALATGLLVLLLTGVEWKATRIFRTGTAPAEGAP